MAKMNANEHQSSEKHAIREAQSTLLLKKDCRTTNLLYSIPALSRSAQDFRKTQT